MERSKCLMSRGCLVVYDVHWLWWWFLLMDLSCDVNERNYVMLVLHILIEMVEFVLLSIGGFWLTIWNKFSYKSFTILESIFEASNVYFLSHFSLTFGICLVAYGWFYLVRLPLCVTHVIVTVMILNCAFGGANDFQGGFSSW